MARYGGAHPPPQPSLPLSRSTRRHRRSAAMQIPHDGFVLVADGRKSLFFRNEGDGDFPNLIVEREDAHPDAKDREIKSDEPGRAFSSTGGGSRSAYEETDFHQHEEDRFAAATAEMLKTRALRNDYETLVVVAPARTLGELRKHYHKEVQRRLVGEVAKDLVNVPVAEIEKILQEQ
jgi:protein required for attachment to host cells